MLTFPVTSSDRSLDHWFVNEASMIASANFMIFRGIKSAVRN